MNTGKTYGKRPADGKGDAVCNRKPSERRPSGQDAGLVPGLQKTIGNAAVQRLFRLAIQPRLEVGGPGDVYEQEADRVAARVMRMSETAIRLKPS